MSPITVRDVVDHPIVEDDIDYWSKDYAEKIGFYDASGVEDVLRNFAVTMTKQLLAADDLPAPDTSKEDWPDRLADALYDYVDLDAILATHTRLINTTLRRRFSEDPGYLESILARILRCSGMVTCTMLAGEDPMDLLMTPESQQSRLLERAANMVFSEYQVLLEDADDPSVAKRLMQRIHGSSTEDPA